MRVFAYLSKDFEWVEGALLELKTRLESSGHSCNRSEVIRTALARGLYEFAPPDVQATIFHPPRGPVDTAEPPKPSECKEIFRTRNLDIEGDSDLVEEWLAKFSPKDSNG